MAIAVSVFLASAASHGAAAQEVVLRVVDSESGLPLPDVVVELVTSGGGSVVSVATGVQGMASLTATDRGRHGLILSSVGYETRRLDIDIGPGTLDLGRVALDSRAFVLNPVVVTASRTTEKALDAPASVHTVGRREIEEGTATTVVDHLRFVPGVDVVNSGISRPAVAVRGFQTAFSTDLMVLTDNRWSSMPSLRFNAYNMLSASNEDIERVEVVLGPGSALYGPNTTTGVMHIITKSPFDYPGMSASLATGERALLQGSLRYADVLSDRFAYKVSGTYFRGDEWPFVDPVEEDNRATALAGGADPATLLIGKRDFQTERYNVDARVDVRLSDDATVVVSGGRAELVNTIEMSSTGTSQALGWAGSYGQARLQAGRLFAQAYVNWTDAGETYSLRSGERLTDNSLLFVTQVQHTADVGARQRFVYGTDMIRTIPRTGGTIHGANEDGDETLELGAYVQSQTTLAERLELVLATRVDRHDYLRKTVFSPRAALVFAPTDDGNVRFTYNRAFRMPSSTVLFLDLLSSPTLGGLPYAIRVAGRPRDGYTFRRDCAGGLCMRSPFTPAGAGGASQPVPLDAAAYWGAAVQIVTAVDPVGGGALAAMAPPTSSQVGSVMAELNLGTGSFDPVQTVTDLGAPRPPIQSTFELGYKGVLGDRIFLGVDIYHTRMKDRVSPVVTLTPNVFFDPQGLGAHIQSEAARLGLPLTPDDVTALTAAMARIPVGTVAPEDNPGGGADVVLTFQNFGEIDYWGSDVSASILASDRVTVSASYSYTSRNLFEDVDGFDIHANAPRNKASLGLDYSDVRSGVSVQAGGRYVEGFDYASGVHAGPVDTYALLDLRLGYALPFSPGTRVTLSGTNVLDNMHQEAAGAPFLGRMVMLRISRSF